ncbi:hypothetical protein DFH06DRAFT_1141482 [Mycena polygramma]|nr:hypothetical protein DFH06DRAFT_1141482 [Mycena polygramma]
MYANRKVFKRHRGCIRQITMRVNKIGHRCGFMRMGWLGQVRGRSRRGEVLSGDLHSEQLTTPESNQACGSAGSECDSQPRAPRDTVVQRSFWSMQCCYGDRLGVHRTGSTLQSKARARRQGLPRAIHADMVGADKFPSVQPNYGEYIELRQTRLRAMLKKSPCARSPPMINGQGDRDTIQERRGRLKRCRRGQPRKANFFWEAVMSNGKLRRTVLNVDNIRRGGWLRDPRGWNRHVRPRPPLHPPHLKRNKLVTSCGASRQIPANRKTNKDRPGQKPTLYALRVELDLLQIFPGHLTDGVRNVLKATPNICSKSGPNPHLRPAMDENVLNVSNVKGIELWNMAYIT